MNSSRDAISGPGSEALLAARSSSNPAQPHGGTGCGTVSNSGGLAGDTNGGSGGDALAAGSGGNARDGAGGNTAGVATGVVPGGQGGGVAGGTAGTLMGGASGGTGGTSGSGGAEAPGTVVLPIRSSGSASSSVGFAPAGTSTFAEAATMTTAAETATSIPVSTTWAPTSCLSGIHRAGSWVNHRPC